MADLHFHKKRGRGAGTDGRPEQGARCDGGTARAGRLVAAGVNPAGGWGGEMTAGVDPAGDFSCRKRQQSNLEHLPAAKTNETPPLAASMCSKICSLPPNAPKWRHGARRPLPAPARSRTRPAPPDTRPVPPRSPQQPAFATRRRRFARRSTRHPPRSRRARPRSACRTRARHAPRPAHRARARRTPRRSASCAVCQAGRTP